MIVDVVMWLILIVLMVGFHEFGHIMVADDNFKVGIDKRGLYTDVEPKSKKEQRKIALGGVLLGFIPIFLCAAVYGYLAFFMLAIYLIGVKDDLREILY